MKKLFGILAVLLALPALGQWTDRGNAKRIQNVPVDVPAAADDQQCATYDLASASIKWIACVGSEVDGVIGNEVTNTTDATLTRSGSGTAGSPYTLGLALGNANTWTAAQTVPGLVVSGTLGADILSGTGAFGADTGWTHTGAWTIAGGVAARTPSATNLTLVSTTPCVAGTYYLLRWDVPTLTASTFTPSAGGWTGAAVSAAATGITSYFYATTTGALTFTATATSAGTIDNVTLQPVTASELLTNAMLTSTTATQPVMISRVLNSATGNEAAVQIAYQTNKATSGNDIGLQIDMADTASPGSSYPLCINVGGTNKFYVDSGGTAYVGKNAAVVGTVSGSSLITSGTIQLTNTGQIGFSSTTSATGTKDAGVARDGVNGIRSTDGSTGYGYVKSDESYVVGSNGETANTTSISEEITLSTTGLTTDSTANLLPANSEILGVTARVTTTITNVTSWALGDSAVSARFLTATTDLTAGTTKVGWNHRQGSVAADNAGPVQVTAAKLRITCTTAGSNPDAGKVRVTVFYRQLTPPST